MTSLEAVASIVLGSFQKRRDGSHRFDVVGFLIFIFVAVVYDQVFFLLACRLLKMDTVPQAPLPPAPPRPTAAPASHRC